MAKKNEAVPEVAEPQVAEPRTRLRVPPGTGSLGVESGRHYRPDNSGVIEVHTDDVPALLSAGCVPE